MASDRETTPLAAEDKLLTRYLQDMNSYEERLAFCKESVPGWSNLDINSLEYKPLAGGTQSIVGLVKVSTEDCDVKEVVYRQIPIEEGVGEDTGKAQEVNDRFVKMAADTGITPKIYAEKGISRVTEFCRGEDLFEGSTAFDWLAWHRSGYGVCWRIMSCFDKKVKVCFPPNNSPNDPDLMERVGTAVGGIHNLDIEWLRKLIGEEEFKRRHDDMVVWTRGVEFCMNNDAAEWFPGFRYSGAMCSIVGGILILIIALIGEHEMRLAFELQAGKKLRSFLIVGMLMLFFGVWEAFRFSQLPDRWRALTMRMKNSPCLPRDGLFAKPVWSHTDLHGGNFKLQAGKKVRIIDWDGLTLAHRGLDVAFFFGSAHMPSLEARKAFARGYLLAVLGDTEAGNAGSELSEKDIETFLWKIECCMPMAMAIWAQSYLQWPNLMPHAGRMVDLLERCLDFMESDVSPETEKAIVEQGLINMMDSTFSCSCLTMIPCCCFR